MMGARMPAGVHNLVGTRLERVLGATCSSSSGGGGFNSMRFQ